MSKPSQGNSVRLRVARRLSISSQPRGETLGPFLENAVPPAWDEALSAAPVAQISTDPAICRQPARGSRTVRELTRATAHRRSWAASFNVGTWLRVFARPAPHHGDDFCMLCSTRQAPTHEATLPYVQMVDIDSLL